MFFNNEFKSQKQVLYDNDASQEDGDNAVELMNLITAFLYIFVPPLKDLKMKNTAADTLEKLPTVPSA